MSASKEIVVLIPHYNNPEGLQKSIVSIQEKIAVDVLVVDDGSTGLLINEAQIRETAPKSVNLYFIYLEKNKGIEAALNTGLEHILNQKYRYIARLDCGDLCVPDRFKLQWEHLKADPELGLVGSYAHFVDSDGKRLFDLKPPTDFENIRKRMYVNAMFIHPTVMFTDAVLRKVGLYPTTYLAAEDYAFFFKIIKNFKAENLPLFLVSCEINPDGISLQKRDEQVATRIRILNEEFYWGTYPVYGLLRNWIIAKTPYSFIYGIKKLLS